MITGKRAVCLLSIFTIIQCAIYIPYVGTGFITDDFIWITDTVRGSGMDYLRPFSVTSGFYRPLVSLSFGIQYRIFGLNPLPYGWFNLGIHLANIWLIFWLLWSITDARRFALPVAVLFAFNAKAVSMALGWISGRTTLMFAFFLLLAFLLLVKAVQLGRKSSRGLLFTLSGCAYFASLLCKETAAAAPVFLVCLFLLPVFRGLSFRSKAVIAAVYLLPLILYIVMRLNSNAMSPLTAPDYYRYTASPGVLAVNLWEYVTRAGLTDLTVLVLLTLTGALKGVRFFSRRRRDDQPAVPLITIGLLWYFCFLLPVFFLPVRSNLYVYLPQLGVHLAFMEFILRRRWMPDNVPWKVPVVLLFILWSAVSWNCIRHYREVGGCSSVFITRLKSALTDLKKQPRGELACRILVIDPAAYPRGKKNYSPAFTVGYGLEALVDILTESPKKIRCRFIAPDNLGTKVPGLLGGRTVLYLWNQGELKGPIRCPKIYSPGQMIKNRQNNTL